MGLRDWFIRREALAEVKRAQAYVAGLTVGGSMIWLKSLGVAFLGGALTALADALANGASFDPAGLRHIGSVALAGGVVAVAAYLRQSPITPKP